MANRKSRVTFVSTEDRKTGVSLSIKTLGLNPVKNKDVLIKPNFNTADLTPGSTHNDTLVALAEEVWKMGAKSVRLGEMRPVIAELVVNETTVVFSKVPMNQAVKITPATPPTTLKKERPARPISPMTSPAAVPMIGIIKGAIIMAPMMVAVESPSTQ